MVRLKGIEFGNVFAASGTLNFFGQGWPHQQIIIGIIPGFDLSGATFISKTTTLEPRRGNMPLDGSYRPEKLFPDCIKVFPLKGVVLNAVGLSGPGAETLFKAGHWQNRKNPFFISFMAVGETKEGRLDEMERFVDLLKSHLPGFKAQIALEVSVTCPNTEHDPQELVLEAIELLQIVRAKLSIPVTLKINVLTAIKSVKEITDSGLCDALSLSNAIPWGQLPKIIDWKKIFGTTVSPFVRYDYGEGALSGRLLLPIVEDYIKELRKAKISISVIAGGGVLNKKGVRILKNAGADAIALASITILRPWRTKGTINYANQLFGG